MCAHQLPQVVAVAVGSLHIAEETTPRADIVAVIRPIAVVIVVVHRIVLPLRQVLARVVAHHIAEVHHMAVAVAIRAADSIRS